MSQIIVRVVPSAICWTASGRSHPHTVYGSWHGPATQQLTEVGSTPLKCFFSFLNTISDGCCCYPGLGKILLQQKMEIDNGMLYAKSECRVGATVDGKWSQQPEITRVVVRTGSSLGLQSSSADGNVCFNLEQC